MKDSKIHSSHNEHSDWMNILGIQMLFKHPPLRIIKIKQNMIHTVQKQEIHHTNQKVCRYIFSGAVILKGCRVCR